MARFTYCYIEISFCEIINILEVLCSRWSALITLKVLISGHIPHPWIHLCPQAIFYFEDFFGCLKSLEMNNCFIFHPASHSASKSANSFFTSSLSCCTLPYATRSNQRTLSTFLPFFLFAYYCFVSI